MAHSLNNTTKTQFMHREASFATRGTRSGVNLLGWEEDESELTLAQRREALILAIKAISEKIEFMTGVGKNKWKKKELGKKKLDLQRQITDVNKKLRRNNMTSKEFQSVLMEELREATPKDVWAKCLRAAQLKFSNQLESRRQAGKGH